MPTQKIFKQRVRARMAKTGESYTAARHQLLRKATEPELPEAPSPSAANPAPATAYTVSDEAMRRTTGRGHEEWFALLDEWGAAEQSHTAIARWLQEAHDVPGWWSQSITVGYERARGRRALHQMARGFTVGATKTVGVSADRALAAFTDESLRTRWLADVPLRRRPTRAPIVARFDWPDPPSRLVVSVDAKGPDKVVVAVAHEQLPDAETAERVKLDWRQRLGELKRFLEGREQ